MSNLRTIFRPNAVFASFVCSRNRFRVGSLSPGSPFPNPNRSSGLPCPSSFSDSSDFVWRYNKPCFRVSRRRHYGVQAAKWADELSPYEVLGFSHRSCEPFIGKSVLLRVLMVLSLQSNCTEDED